MSRSYIPHNLIHAHLPCPPTIPNSIPELHIPSDYSSSPSSSSDAHFYEHALSFSYSPSLNVLARVINNGYTLELRAFDTAIQSDCNQQGKGEDGSRIIRVFFPQQIKSLPEDCIIVSPLDRRVYVLVYTEEIEEESSRNVLYRLNFPLGSAKLGQGSRFSFTTRGNDDWVEEFQVPHDSLVNCGGVGAWTVVDELNVLLGGGDGGILRLTRSNRGIHGMLCCSRQTYADSQALGLYTITECPHAFDYLPCSPRHHRMNKSSPSPIYMSTSTSSSSTLCRGTASCESGTA